MNTLKKEILSKSVEICDSVAISIRKKNYGQTNCQAYCPGKDQLKSTIKLLSENFMDLEHECCRRLNNELEHLVENNQCVNPYSFGGIVAVVSVLREKYLIKRGLSKKVFISHSSEDKGVVNAFIKDVLKIGIGFKESDLFCTLDSSSIKTGDDFREKIVENMRGADFILMFISKNYNLSEICKNELGAAWTFKNKRILPFVLPHTSFDQMGFLNIVKQGADITDKVKLDEFYKEVCDYYAIEADWPAFNKAKEDFIEYIKE